MVTQIFAVVGDAAAGAAHGEAGAQDGGVAVFGGEGEAAFDVGDELRGGRFEADLAHRVFEEQPVFGLLDGVDFGADQFDAVAIEDAGFGQFDRKVQGGLSADRGEQGIGAFFGDDLFEVGAAERLDVGAVGQFRIRHDGGRIGIDEDDFVAIGAQGLGGLGAGVIEFAGLADDDGAGTDDQDAVEVVASWHLFRLRHEFCEVVEEVVRVVRAGRGFGMILHAEDRLAAMAEAFERLVVEIDVGDVDVVVAERIGIDREAVIVRGDFDALRQFVDAPDDWRRGGRISVCRFCRRGRGRESGGRGRCRRSASCR